MVVLWGLRSFHLVSSSTLTFSPRLFATSCTFSRRGRSRVGEERWGAYEESDRGKRLVESVEEREEGSEGERRRLAVSVLGIPNSGKSTLVNQLVGRRVCPASARDNTTQRNARAILTSGQVQVEFLDTPGIVTQEAVDKFKLKPEVVKGPEDSCIKADLLVVVHDVSNRYVREAIPPKVLRLLCLYHGRVPAILVMNKMDQIPKSRRVFDLIRKLTCNRLDDGQAVVKIAPGDTEGCSVQKYLKRKEAAMAGEQEAVTDFADVLEAARRGGLTEARVEGLTAGLLGWPGFRDVFTVSALTGDGVEDLRAYMEDQARPAAWRFPRDTVTDQQPKLLAIALLRSKLLTYLPGTIPYSMQPIINVWSMDHDLETLIIMVDIATSNPSMHRTAIGRKGGTVTKIREEMEEELGEHFGHRVRFHINLKPNFTIKQEAAPQTRGVDLFF